MTCMIKLSKRLRMANAHGAGQCKPVEFRRYPAILARLQVQAYPVLVLPLLLAQPGWKCQTVCLPAQAELLRL